MKFKAGDRVKIKSWEEMSKEYEIDESGDILTPSGIYFVEDMKHLCGRTATITRLENHRIELDFDDKSGRTMWSCSVEMVKPINECIVIYRKGDDVIALNKATGKKATATCSKDDEFNFETGAKLAFERLLVHGVREIKRNAKKGEYIKVVDAGSDFAKIPTTNGVPEYKNGDIFKVIDASTASGLARYKEGYADNGAPRALLPREYVVLEGYEPPKEEKDNSIKVGDTVKVVDCGKSCSTNVPFFENNGLEEELKRYAYGFSPKNGYMGEVLAIKGNMAVIKCETENLETKANFLIGLKGLSKVISEA